MIDVDAEKGNQHTHNTQSVVRNSIFGATKDRKFTIFEIVKLMKVIDADTKNSHDHDLNGYSVGDKDIGGLIVTLAAPHSRNDDTTTQHRR